MKILLEMSLTGSVQESATSSQSPVPFLTRYAHWFSGLYEGSLAIHKELDAFGQMIPSHAALNVTTLV
jgi:hypothetical protein